MGHSRLLTLAALAVTLLVLIPAPAAALDGPRNYGVSVETSVSFGPFEKYLGHAPKVIRNLVWNIVELLKQLHLRPTALVPVAIQILIVVLRLIGKTLHKEKETGHYVSELEGVMDAARHTSPIADKEIEEAKKEVPDPIACILGLISKLADPLHGLLGGHDDEDEHGGPHGSFGLDLDGHGHGPDGGDGHGGGGLLGKLPLGGLPLGAAGGLARGVGGRLTQGLPLGAHLGGVLGR